MAKPTGSKCNLDCAYCYYLEKEKLYPGKSSWVMSDEVLEAYIKGIVDGNDTPEVDFVWQGGEPTLLGIPFFEKVLALQNRFGKGRRISNALQTNGTLIDDDWGAFLKQNRFLIGLSLDGPEALHDRYRVDKRGAPTFSKAMKGWEVLRRHRVDTNVLCVVNRTNGDHPLEIYRFFKEIGVQFIQFIPVVERVGTKVADYSVEPLQYGEFLVSIYDEWVSQDVGRTFVQLFDICLNAWVGRPSPLCWFRKTCGSALALEHNGDLYSCDHYVYPEYLLGNILQKPMAELARSKRQVQFGEDKSSTLPRYCLECEVRFVCNGECPKRRFVETPEGEKGLNYLCPAYRRFFNHVDPTMKKMAQLVLAGRPAADIMAS